MEILKGKLKMLHLNVILQIEKNIYIYNNINLN